MITFQTITVIAACIVVLMVPATRTEIRNTRESPLRPVASAWRPAASANVWVIGAATPRTIVVPYDPPVTGYRPRTGPAKRRIAPGYGKLTRTRTGPLAWIWAELDPRTYPVRAASDGRILAA